MIGLYILINALLLYLMFLSFHKPRGRGGKENNAPPVQNTRPEECSKGAYNTSITATLETMLKRAIEEERKAAAIVERSEYMNSFGGVVIGEKTLKKQKNELYTAQRKRLAIEARLRREISNKGGV